MVGCFFDQPWEGIKQSIDGSQASSVKSDWLEVWSIPQRMTEDVTLSARAYVGYVRIIGGNGMER